MITTDSIILPQHIEAEVLQKIMVLLVTVNNIEILATLVYLQPLDGHKNIYRFVQGGQQTEEVTYYIGKYGNCSAAIGFSPNYKVHSSNSTVPIMVDNCFPNLAAIISVGVICGIKEKVQLYDVIVSSKVVRCENVKHSPNKAIDVPPKLLKLFTQPIQWPTDTILKYMNINGVQKPSVKSGVVFTGPSSVTYDSLMNESLISNDTISIEMDKAHLFAAKQQTQTNIIIVKAVCNYYNGGENIEVHRPTAALLPADLVYKCLSDPQAYDEFKSMHNYLVAIISYYMY